jgi:hypothetical protein
MMNDDDEGLSRINRLVDRMFAEGLLTEPDHNGARSLTPKGKRFAARVEAFQAIRNTLDARFDPETILEGAAFWLGFNNLPCDAHRIVDESIEAGREEAKEAAEEEAEGAAATEEVVKVVNEAVKEIVGTRPRRRLRPRKRPRSRET